MTDKMGPNKIKKKGKFSCSQKCLTWHKRMNNSYVTSQEIALLVSK